MLEEELSQDCNRRCWTRGYEQIYYKDFNDINAQLKDKMYREKAEEIFKCIPMKMELFYDKFA